MLLSLYNDQGLVEAGCDEAGRGCLAGPVFAGAVVLPEGYENELLNDSKQLTAKRRYALREQIERDAVAWAVATATAGEIDRINILNASILAMHRALDALAMSVSEKHAVDQNGRGCGGQQVNPQFIIVDGNKWKGYQPGLATSLTAQEWLKAMPSGFSLSQPRQITMNGKQGETPTNGEQADTGVGAQTIVKGDGKYLAIAAASILAKTYRDDHMKALHAEFPYYGWDRNAGYPTKEHREGILQHGITPHHRLTFGGVADTLQRFEGF